MKISFIAVIVSCSFFIMPVSHAKNRDGVHIDTDCSMQSHDILSELLNDKVNASQRNRVDLDISILKNNASRANHIIDNWHGAESTMAAKEAIQSGITLALMRGNLQIVKLLLTKGADPNLPGHYGNPPLVIASNCGHMDVVQELVRSGARVNVKNSFGETPLDAAMYGKHPDVAAWLLDHGFDVCRMEDTKKLSRFVSIAEKHELPKSLLTKMRCQNRH